MQLTQNSINDNSTRICTRLPSGFVLEVTSDSSGHGVVTASPVDQNLHQYFVITKVPGQESYTIENTAATGTFLKPTTPSTISASPTLIASSRRLTDRSQEWKFIFEENANGWDYYLIESVRYPGNVLVLDQTRVTLNIRNQSSQPAVDQHWALIPACVPPDYYNNHNNSTELQSLKDEVAELKEEIKEKDSLLNDKVNEINQLKELINALSTPTVSIPEPEVHAGQAMIAVALTDFEAIEDFELSLLEGEYIEHIKMCNNGWWSGVGPEGKTGLFPSHFVRLVETFEAPEAPEARPSPSLTGSQVGATAVALYDYDGAEDNQVTFREGDIITDLVAETWWRGKSPRGDIGLFPAIYVHVQSQQRYIPERLSPTLEETNRLLD